MTCDCGGTGTVLAWSREDLNAAPFVFACCTPRKFPKWSQRDPSKWVRCEGEVEGCTPAWVLAEVEAGRADGDEFKAKLKQWGREFVLEVWKQAAAEKAADQAREAGKGNG